MLVRLATFSYRRRRIVVIAWIVALVGISVVGQTVGGTLLKSFTVSGTESQRAFDVLGKTFDRKGDTGDLVYEVQGGGTVRDAAVHTEVDAIVAKIRKQPHVVSVTTPYDQSGARFIAKSGTIAYAEILFDVQANDVPLDVGTNMRTIAKQANSADLKVELGGTMFTDQT